MTTDHALFLVKKYAKQHGVRKAARIFKIAPGTVSMIANNKGKISGARIAAKVAAAGTFTCPGLGVLLLPEICLQHRECIHQHSWDGIPRDLRRLVNFCPKCKIGMDLCQEK